MTELMIDTWRFLEGRKCKAVIFNAQGVWLQFEGDCMFGPLTGEEGIKENLESQYEYAKVAQEAQ